jgi:rod shape determining protein RodA
MLRPKFDWYLLLPVLFLLGFSVGIIASISPANLPQHLVCILLGLGAFLLFSFLDLEILFPLSPLIYLFSLFFLTLPFLVGTVTRGSVRWIPVAGFTIQPSEIVKPFLALVAAWFWTKEAFSFKRVLTFIGLLLPATFLIFFQPDLGSTLVVLSIFFGVFLYSGIKGRHLLLLALVVALVIPVAWFGLHDYQRLRVIHFLDPYADPLGEGYNLIQSKIAVGSGGFSGRGWGRGTQSHLAFLPEKHTDFIFASLAEELGLTGAAAVFFLYLLLFWRILKIAQQSRERSLFLLSLGLFFALFFQTVVNLGMNMGLLPIAGVTLPLISYGGSSLLATMTALGILEAISRRRGEEKVLEIK